MKDPLRNIKTRSRNKRTEGASLKALAEGIEIGKQESADSDKIEDQDQQIKEQKERINRLSEQLALEAAHLLLANQRSDLRARSISTLTADADRQREENTRLEQRVALLTGQLAQRFFGRPCRGLSTAQSPSFELTYGTIDQSHQILTSQ